MAKVTMTFCMVGNRSQEGGSMPVPCMAGCETEVLESGGASIRGTLASAAPEGFGFVSVTVEGNAVFVTAGAAPVAAASNARTNGFLILDGQTRDFAVRHGDRLAVIDR
jgi:hypothetical protein